MTRQQRRRDRRRKNKKIYNASKKFSTRTRMDAEGLKRLADYRIESKGPAILMHGMRFGKDSTLSDYIHLCHEAAGSLEDIDEPQWILLLRDSENVSFPVPKSELMKIATRIFKKSLKRPFLFLDLTAQELEAGEAERRVMEFILKFNEIPEDGDFPEWLSEYVYRDTKKPRKNNAMNK